MREWADGQVRDIVQGEDFFCTLASMRGSMGAWAGRNGYRFHSTTRFVPEGTIRFSLERKPA